MRISIETNAKDALYSGSIIINQENLSYIKIDLVNGGDNRGLPCISLFDKDRKYLDGVVLPSTYETIRIEGD